MRLGELVRRFDDFNRRWFPFSCLAMRAPKRPWAPLKKHSSMPWARGAYSSSQTAGDLNERACRSRRKVLPFMQQHDIDTMLVRPDYYVYGAVSDIADLNQLIDDLQSDLERNGLRPVQAHQASSWQCT